MLQVPLDLNPLEVWDLGCGTGEHAAALAGRHPAAVVHGLDSSARMLARARARQAPVDWIQADIAGFAPDAPADLIFSNAALHWLPDHAALFPRMAGALAEGGVLACQMPTAHESEWHLALRALAAEAPWRERLAAVDGVHPVARPEQYHDWLTPICGEVDIWSTTYLHGLEGEDPVVDWMRGTALRPYLDALTDEAEREAFLDDYRRRVRAVLPPRGDGVTLLPFPRLFIVARR